MCALFMSAGNGNACAQMSQDRQRGEENCKLTQKIGRLQGINFFIDFDGRIERENFASLMRPGRRQKLQICIVLALALKSHFR